MSKIDDFDVRGIPQEQVDLNDDIRTILNFGKYQFTVVGSVPTWRGRRGECAFVMATTGVFFVCTTDNNTTWRAVATFTL